MALLLTMILPVWCLINIYYGIKWVDFLGKIGVQITHEIPMLAFIFGILITSISMMFM